MEQEMSSTSSKLPSSADRFDRLVTQLNWRLTEGDGLCMYEVGVLDDGTLAGIPREDMRKSLANLCAMAQVLDAKPEICRLMMIRTGEGDGPTVHILSDDDEARMHLGIDAGLPDAEVVGVQIPRDHHSYDLLRLCTGTYFGYDLINKVKMTMADSCPIRRP